jgi:hypothetical protein
MKGMCVSVLYNIIPAVQSIIYQHGDVERMLTGNEYHATTAQLTAAKITPISRVAEKLMTADYSSLLSCLALFPILSNFYSREVES